MPLSVPSHFSLLDLGQGLSDQISFSCQSSELRARQESSLTATDNCGSQILNLALFSAKTVQKSKKDTRVGPICHLLLLCERMTWVARICTPSRLNPSVLAKKEQEEITGDLSLGQASFALVESSQMVVLVSCAQNFLRICSCVKDKGTLFGHLWMRSS